VRFEKFKLKKVKKFFKFKKYYSSQKLKIVRIVYSHRWTRADLASNFRGPNLKRA